MKKSRFDRTYDSAMDGKQLVFDRAAELHEKPKRTTEVLASTTVCLCPFCMYEGGTDKFVVSTGKGFHHGIGKCPNCGNQAQWKTLHTKWTAESLAGWVYEYSGQGYWQKVKYKEFNAGLRVKGWLEDFWTRYRELKGDVDGQTESYSDYIDRAQREQAVEQGWTEEDRCHHG